MVKFGIPGQGRDPLAYTDQRLSGVPTVDSPIDPTVNDIFPIQTIWRNKTSFDEFILVGFTGGDAIWVPFTSSTGSVLELRADDTNLVQALVGVIDIDGTTVAYGANAKPVFTDGATANTMELQVQLGTVVAPTPVNVNKAGLVCVNTNQFTIDAVSGMVSLKGGTVSPPILSYTMDDTNQVFADATGDVDVVGNAVANAAHAKPLFSKKGSAADDFEFDIQVAVARTGPPAALDYTQAGISSYDDTVFSVTDGYVTLKTGPGPAMDDLRDQVNAAIGVSAAGNIDIDGVIVANAANPSTIPLETVKSGTANTMDVQLQIATTVTPTPANVNKAGIACFNVNHFVFDATSAMVSLVGSIGFLWVEETGATRALLINQGVVGNRGTAQTFTLPATAIFGSEIRILNKGAGLITIAQNAGQTIHFGNIDSTTGAGGTVAATAQWDGLHLVCTTADTDWTLLDAGAWNIV